MYNNPFKRGENKQTENNMKKQKIERKYSLKIRAHCGRDDLEGKINHTESEIAPYRRVISCVKFVIYCSIRVKINLFEINSNYWIFFVGFFSFENIDIPGAIRDNIQSKDYYFHTGVR